MYSVKIELSGHFCHSICIVLYLHHKALLHSFIFQQYLYQRLFCKSFVVYLTLYRICICKRCCAVFARCCIASVFARDDVCISICKKKQLVHISICKIIVLVFARAVVPYQYLQEETVVLQQVENWFPPPPLHPRGVAPPHHCQPKQTNTLELQNKYKYKHGTDLGLFCSFDCNGLFSVAGLL